MNRQANNAEQFRPGSALLWLGSNAPLEIETFIDFAKQYSNIVYNADDDKVGIALRDAYGLLTNVSTCIEHKGNLRDVEAQLAKIRTKLSELVSEASAVVVCTYDDVMYQAEHELAVESFVKDVATPYWQYDLLDFSKSSEVMSAMLVQLCKETHTPYCMLSFGNLRFLGEHNVTINCVDDVWAELNNRVAGILNGSAFIVSHDEAAKNSIRINGMQINTGNLKLDGFNLVRDAVFGLASKRGLYDKNPSIGDLLMHLVGECNEAHVAFAENLHATEADIAELKRLADEDNHDVFIKYFKSSVKSTFGDELADIILMCLSIAGRFDIDIASHIELKHQYNAMRSEHSAIN